ncbi:hypothetical protein J4438_03190 [Candidatus Woesearchaeota archaeon]|nr:hypothetical protein [Candidatus Woesearchaeota archaeon]
MTEEINLQRLLAKLEQLPIESFSWNGDNFNVTIEDFEIQFNADRCGISFSSFYIDVIHYGQPLKRISSEKSSDSNEYEQLVQTYNRIHEKRSAYVNRRNEELTKKLNDLL